MGMTEQVAEMLNAGEDYATIAETLQKNQDAIIKAAARARSRGLLPRDFQPPKSKRFFRLPGPDADPEPEAEPAKVPRVDPRLAAANAAEDVIVRAVRIAFTGSATAEDFARGLEMIATEMDTVVRRLKALEAVRKLFADSAAAPPATTPPPNGEGNA
jgi:hypothetical protein